MFSKFCSWTGMLLLASTWAHCYGQAKNSNEIRALRLRTAHELVERARGFEDLQTKTTTLVSLASLLWQYEAEAVYAKQIFIRLRDELKLAASTQSQLSSSAPRLNIPRLQQVVLKSLAKFDSKLAIAWFEEDLAVDSKLVAAHRLGFALDLASEGNSEDAARLASSAVAGGLSGLDLRLVMVMLHRLRVSNQTEADALFLGILGKLIHEPLITPEELLIIGNYLFINDSDATPESIKYTGVKVGDLYFPVGISGQRAGITKQLVRAYLEASASVLNRLLGQPSIQFPKRYAATARMLLEKAEKFVPELVPSLTALTREFSVSVITDAPFPRNDSKPKLINYESVSPELEKLQGRARDEMCLALIETAYLQNDLDTAAKLAQLIADEKGKARVEELIAFRRAANCLEGDNGPGAEKVASRLTNPELIVLIRLGLANREIKSQHPSLALVHLQSVTTLVREHEIKSSGLYLLNAASLYMEVDSNTGLQIFNQAAKALDDAAAGIAELTKREQISTVRLGNTTATFSLNSKGIRFHTIDVLLAGIMRQARNHALPTILRMKNEKVLGPVLVAAAKALLVKNSSE